ncbi:MAG: phasin [Hyphomicrobiales bacterium]|nr:phasin [Hyphomicrobiales bacterium]
MSDQGPFEIPQNMRELAEQSLEQAKTAYNQFMETSRNAQEVLEQSSDTMTSSAKEVQQKAIEYAESNMQAGFDLANKLVLAKDMMEALQIQSTYTRQQMESYTRQVQELSSLMASAAKKAQPK